MLEFENKPNQVQQAAKKKSVKCYVRVQETKGESNNENMLEKQNPFD